ncbi:hypothetical protein RJT34_16674 [Clitoria ternatea]|uniref:Uncharacterized protein n=1 Tax=Clitoria ternatea TaxID=43366 RepID=A0AAN9JAN6_CLITE
MPEIESVGKRQKVELMEGSSYLGLLLPFSLTTLIWIELILIGKPVLIEVNKLSLSLHNSAQQCSRVAVGSGWQSYVTYINLGCYHIIGVPLGFLMGWVFNQRVISRTNPITIRAKLKNMLPHAPKKQLCPLQEIEENISVKEIVMDTLEEEEKGEALEFLN